MDAAQPVRARVHARRRSPTWCASSCRSGRRYVTGQRIGVDGGPVLDARARPSRTYAGTVGTIASCSRSSRSCSSCCRSSRSRVAIQVAHAHRRRSNTLGLLDRCSRSSGAWLAKRQGFARAARACGTRSTQGSVPGQRAHRRRRSCSSAASCSSCPASSPTRSGCSCCSRRRARGRAQLRASAAFRHRASTAIGPIGTDGPAARRHRRLTPTVSRAGGAARARPGSRNAPRRRIARCTPRGPAMQSTRSSESSSTGSVVVEVVGGRERRAPHDVVEPRRAARARRRRSPTPRARPRRACRARRWCRPGRGSGRARSRPPARGSAARR